MPCAARDRVICARNASYAAKGPTACPRVAIPMREVREGAIHEVHEGSTACLRVAIPMREVRDGAIHEVREGACLRVAIPMRVLYVV